MGNQQNYDQDRTIRELFRIIKTDRSTGCTFLEERQTGREFMLKEYSTNSN